MSARRKASHKMFKPPKDPFEEEDALNVMQPLDADQKKRMLEIANELIASDRVGAREKKALQIWKVSILAKGFEGIVKKEFQKDFWRWLLGRGKEEDHQKTQWYRDKLTDDIEVSHYVDSFISKYHMFRVKLKLLSMRRPIGINQTYLYFKYIVRGKEANQNNFLDDWDIMIKEFDEAGNWQEGRRPGYGPHEVRPWEPRAIEAARAENTEEKRLDSYTGNWPSGPGGQNPPKDEFGDFKKDDDDKKLKPENETLEEASVEVVDAELDSEDDDTEPMLQVVSRLDRLIDVFEQDLNNRRGNPKWPSDKGKEEDDSEEEQSMSLSVENRASFEDLSGNNLALQQYYEQQAASLREEMRRKDEENQKLVQEIRENREALNRIQNIQAIDRTGVQGNMRKLQQQLDESQRREAEIRSALATAQNFAAESEAQRAQLKQQHEKTMQGQEAEMRDFVRNAQSQIDQMGQAMRAGNVSNINQQEKQIQELQELVRDVQEQAKTDLVNLNERHQTYEQAQELNFQKRILEESKKVEGAYERGYKEAEKRLMEETQVQIEEMNKTFAQTFAEQDRLMQNLQASSPHIVKNVMQHAELVEDMEEERESYETGEMEQIAANPIVIEALGEDNAIAKSRKKNKDKVGKRAREAGVSNKRLLRASQANEASSRRQVAQRVVQKNAPPGVSNEVESVHDSESAVENAREIAARKVQKVQAVISQSVSSENQARKQEQWFIGNRKEEINEDLEAMREDEEDLLRQQELLKSGEQARDQILQREAAKARQQRRLLNNILEREQKEQEEAEAVAREREIEDEQDELLQDMEEEERRESLLQEGEKNLEVNRAATAKANQKNLENVIEQEQGELEDAEAAAREMEIDQEQDQMTELLNEQVEGERMEEELQKNLQQRNDLEREFNAAVREAQEIAIASYGGLSPEQLAQADTDQEQLDARMQELEKIKSRLTQEMLALKEAERFVRGIGGKRVERIRYQRVNSSQKGTTSVKNMQRVRNAPVGTARGRTASATISQSKLKESDHYLTAVTRNLQKEIDQMQEDVGEFSEEREQEKEKREREVEMEMEEEVEGEEMQMDMTEDQNSLQNMDDEIENATSKKALERLRDEAADKFEIKVDKLTLPKNPTLTQLNDFREDLQRKLRKKRKNFGMDEVEMEMEEEGPLTQTLMN